MRCPNCNKFVSYDEPSVEVISVEVDDAEVRSEVRVILSCDECCTELKSADMEGSVEVSHTCKTKEEWMAANGISEDNRGPSKDWKDGDDQFEVENDGEGESESRMETLDRHGKPIKSARYMKQFYGFTLDSDIKCLKCGEVFTVTTEGEQQASRFDECC